MTKTNFLGLVQDELNRIKANATAEEKARLNFLEFDYINYKACIYGQMTGDCFSARASQIQQKSYGAVSYKNSGGNVKERTLFKDQIFYEGHDFTALEKYLFMVAKSNGEKSKKHADIIRYIKGEIDTIKL